MGKDDQNEEGFHSGHTQVLGEEELPGAGSPEPAGGSFQAPSSWGAKTMALPPEAFDGLEGLPPTAGGGQSQSGQTMALPDPNAPPGQAGQAGYGPPPGYGPPQGGPPAMGGPPGGQAGPPGYGPPGGQAGPPGYGPPGGQAGPPGYGPPPGGAAPPQGGYGPAPGYGPPQPGGGAPGAGEDGIPYLETMAIVAPSEGMGGAPAYPQPQQPSFPPAPAFAPAPAPAFAPAPAPGMPDDDDEPAPTVLLDASNMAELAALAQGGPPPPGPAQGPPSFPPPAQGPPSFPPPGPPQPQMPPPPAPDTFDSSGLAQGQKTVVLQTDMDLGLQPPPATPALAPSLAGHFVIFVPDTQPIVFELMPGITTIGRGMENHLVLGDPYASRKHFIITCRDGQYAFEDSGSDNGTIVNGGPCQSKPLQTGDLIEVGSVMMRFVMGQVQREHEKQPKATPKSKRTAGRSGGVPAKKGINKLQLFVLIFLVLATIGLIVAMVILYLQRKGG